MEIRSIRKIKKANNRAHNFGESVIQRAAVSGEELLSLTWGWGSSAGQGPEGPLGRETQSQKRSGVSREQNWPQCPEKASACWEYERVWFNFQLQWFLIPVPVLSLERSFWIISQKLLIFYSLSLSSQCQITFWIALNLNFSWSHISELKYLEKPAYVNCQTLLFL